MRNYGKYPTGLVINKIAWWNISMKQKGLTNRKSLALRSVNRFGTNLNRIGDIIFKVSSGVSKAENRKKTDQISFEINKTSIQKSMRNDFIKIRNDLKKAVKEVG